MHIFKRSIRYKLITLLLLSTIIPIAASNLITDIYTKRSLKDRAIEENTRLISEGKSNIINYLDTVKNASLTIYSNATLESILSKGLVDLQSESYIFTIMQILSRSASDIYQVYFSINETDSAYVLYQNNFRRGAANYKPPLDGQASPYEVYTESTHMSHNYKINNPSLFIYPEKVFTVHRPLFRVPTHEQLGLLSIDVKLDALAKLTSQLYDKENEDLYILDNSGAVVYATSDAENNIPANESWMKEIANRPDRSGYMEWDKAEFSGIMVFTKMETAYLNWTMVKRIPYVHLYEYPHRLGLINSLVAVLFLSIAMIAILTVSLRLTKPLKQLIMHMNKIQAGQLDKPIAIDRLDEIGVLAKRFQTMMDTINGLILREYKLKLANKTIQLEMLQAQVNPHFLNNALQSIGNQALESNAPKVYSLVSSLGQMMHYSMNTKETVVPLAKEIDYVMHYCDLQQIRFEDHLQVGFHLSEEAGTIPVPKMTVQPIVENFFKHGFDSGAERTGFLGVTTLLRHDMLYIIVEDNGPGIAEERMRMIRESLSVEELQGESPGSGIGLTNIMQRLRLYYGERAGIELNNLQPYGLKVTLSIPLQFAQEEV